MKTITHPAGKWLLAMIITICPLCLATGQTIYVDAGATGANNGSSWTNAYKYLQNALTAAGSGDSIWVAEGTYKPDANSLYPGGTGSRTATFQLKNNVSIYGGFPAGEGIWESRDPNIYETILSGDINVPDNNSDNSYHVVTGRDVNVNTVLDGFTLTAGNANETSGVNSYGGGMYNYNNSNPSVVNCTFNTNSANSGAGIYNNASSPTLTNCTFIGNSASGTGGGMYNYNNSNPSVVNCTFTDNTAGSNGGGIYNFNSSPTVSNCTFNVNSVGGSGGGMLNDFSSPTVTYCNFSNNSAYSGGGMCNCDYSYPTVEHCVFSSNSITYYSGGGMSNVYHSNPTVVNCIFVGNSAQLGGDGGAMYNNQGSPIVTNCYFSSNSATYGGGMDNEYASNSVLTNCTFGGNSAFRGGGIHDDEYSYVAVTNCIFWGNTATYGPQVYNKAPPTFTITYSDVQGGWTGIGNIDADPCFVEAGHWDVNGTPDDANDDFWVDGNYRLLWDSPCIDAGDSNSVPPDYADLDGDGNKIEPTPLDLDYFARFIDGDCNDSNIVDMGAYEFLHSDINHNGAVNFLDFAMFALHYWETNCGMCGGADLTCDHNVNGFDLLKFAEWWLAGSVF